MKSIKGTRTEQNLLKSFAGESQARNRYTYFASVAKKEGYEQIAAIFEETANQEKEHVLIHRAYAIANPKKYKGYGANSWGFTSSDDPLVGYTSHHPGTPDENGTVSPTAALSSLPYAPQEVLPVFRHFYYDLGKELLGKYGFYDAFNLNMYEKKWDVVLSLTDQIINGSVGSYGLVSDYSKIWREEGENSSESLFEVQARGITPNAGIGGYVDCQGARGSITYPDGTSGISGWGFNSPSQDLENAYEVGDVRKAATIMGDKVNFVYAKGSNFEYDAELESRSAMVDIARDSRWGRVMEGAGEDTYLGSLVAKARVHGFQGNGLGNVDAVMACAKHFAAYGAAIGGRDYNSVDMSLRQLNETYLPPFKAAVEANVATLMD